MNSIAGFCWGSVCDTTELPHRFAANRFPDREEDGRKLIEPLAEMMINKKVERLLFFDEIAVLPGYREKGIDQVRFLTRSGLEKAHSDNVRDAIFWTTPRSPISRITTVLGFEEIYRLNENSTYSSEGKGDYNSIIFLHHSDLSSLLNIAQNMPSEEVAKLMGGIGRTRKIER
jgi:hypothetical protein